MGRRKIDKESYQYYSKQFSAMKSYYTKKGYSLPIKMSKLEWEFKKEATGYSNKKIIYSEFHRFEEEDAKALKQLFREQGLTEDRYSVKRIARGDLSDTEWDIVKNDYKELKKQGYSSRDAKLILGYTFFGSE